ncbi:hypothetical protein ACLB1M_22750 [Escherichia coli]
MQKINFYRNRVAINVLAKDIANARKIFLCRPARRSDWRAFRAVLLGG